MSQEDAYTRALQNGCVWLNPVFVAREGRFRIFRRSSIRLSVPEVVWIFLLMFASAVFIYFTSKMLSYVPGLGSMISPLLFSLLAIPFGWIVGRRVAKASPYRRHSGEGLGVFLLVQADKKNTFIGRMFGRKVAVNQCETYVSGKAEIVPCVEWIGTSRAPMMPKYDPEVGNTDMNVELIPSNEPVAWVAKVRTMERDGRIIRRNSRRD